MTQPAQQASNAQIALVAAVLTAGLAASTAAAYLASVLKVPVPVAAGLLTMHTHAPIVAIPDGPSARTVNAAELSYRAAYLANAGLRIQHRLDSGASPDDAAAPERGLFRMHRQAQGVRARASRAVDALAERFGNRLRWRARMDEKTSPECRAAHNGIFDATRPPAISLPGAVHPHCRCRAVPASAGHGTTTVDQQVSAARVGTEAA